MKKNRPNKKIPKEKLKHETLFDFIHYDSGTGIFRWKTHSGELGEIAGYKITNKRIHIWFAGRFYYAHRLAWFYVYRAWPVGDIDHIDGDPTNNRIDNLRDVSRTVNMQNIKNPFKKNTTGYLGVSREKGKFIARICIGEKVLRIGRYETAIAAHEAYIAAKRKFHPGFVD